MLIDTVIRIFYGKIPGVKKLESHKRKNGPDTSSKSMTRWGRLAIKFLGISYSPVVEPPWVKEAGLKFLAEHNLPRYRKVKVALSSFIANQELVFKDLNARTNTYYISLLNERTGERIFFLDVPKDQVLSKIQEKIESGEIKVEEILLILSEYRSNDYGGNIIIRPGTEERDNLGRVSVEMVVGKHANLAEGQKQLVISALSDQFTGVLKFRINQNELKKEAWNLELKDTSGLSKLKTSIAKAFGVKRILEKEQVLTNDLQTELMGVVNRALACIPNKKEKYTSLENCRFMTEKTSGYYEFIVSRVFDVNTGEEDLEITFIDARPNRSGDKYSAVNDEYLTKRSRQLFLRQEERKRSKNGDKKAEDRQVIQILSAIIKTIAEGR